MTFSFAALTVILSFGISVAAFAQPKDSVPAAISGATPVASKETAKNNTSSSPAKKSPESSACGNTSINIYCSSTGEGAAPSSLKTQEQKDDSWPEIAFKFISALSPYAWPAFFVFAMFFLGRDLFKHQLAGLRRVKGGGFELEFNAERAREVAKQFRQSYADFLQTAQAEYERQVRARRVSDTLLPEAADAVRKLANLSAQEKSLRATVHVPDVVFKNFLYQLVDYFPSGSGSGRRFSVRFGVLGRCWRLAKSLGQGTALRPATGAPLHLDPREGAIYTLITQWGMTRTDAEAAYAARNRQSYLCVLLVAGSDLGGVPVGVLYLDAEDANVFGNDDVATQRATELEKHPAVKALADAIGRMMSELSKGAALLAFPGVQ